LSKIWTVTKWDIFLRHSVHAQYVKKAVILVLTLNRDIMQYNKICVRL